MHDAPGSLPVGPPISWPQTTEDRLDMLAEKLNLHWCDECGDWEHGTKGAEISVPLGNPELIPGPL